MASRDTILAARAITDGDDRLLSADAPLAELQERCGGAIPGTLAVPELLELVRQGRLMGLRLAREFSAFDGEDIVSGFVRITPLNGEHGGGCELLVENWQREALPAENRKFDASRRDAIDRASAELTARLDAAQRVQTIESAAPDLQGLLDAVRSDTRPADQRQWLDYVEPIGIAHRQPLHWRLLDGSRCRVEGSDREWLMRLVPSGPGEDPSGFELLLIADYARDPKEDAGGDEDEQRPSLVGEALMPSLREPIARIIANAETIRARLAGPLREEYSEYAGDISAAGQHLMSLLDDLGDLELVEADDFEPLSERIDLADAGRRAGGILSGEAREKGIVLKLPDEGTSIPATGEYRRVLQILLNLIGNAIAYSPVESTVTVVATTDRRGRPTISVADEGPGLTQDQQERIFKKFERLGRDGDGGSGLGLYISQRLADAMGGSLRIESTAGQGARFTLTLPES